MWPLVAPRGLDAGEVAVWLVDLPRHDVAHARAILTPTELARADRFIKAIDRVRFAVSRASLRRILGAVLGVAPRQVPIEIAHNDKPFVGGETDVCFNLSHSGDLALVAVAKHTELGVDVEKMRDIDVDALSTRFFSANECAVLTSLDPAQRRDAFYCTWVRKEAYIKGRGDGLRLPLHSFDVSLPRHVPAALLASRKFPEDVARWRMAHLDVGPGYEAALAMSGNDALLRHATLRP